MSTDRLDMIWEKNRLESFKKWPYSNKQPCNKTKMAEAGFFWTGTVQDPDSAQCFICNKSLNGWEATDDPWEEHKAHASDCPFVVIGQPEDHLTLSQFFDLWYSTVKQLFTRAYTEHVKTLDAVLSRLQSNTLK